MEVIDIAQTPDLVLVVGRTVKLRVSSAVLKEISYFRRMLNPGCAPGDAFERHRSGDTTALYELKLYDDVDPVGMKLLCDALHGQTSFIPHRFHSKTFRSFAEMVYLCQCGDVVKHAATLALDSLPIELIDELPKLFINVAGSFDHAERFSEYTDYISKYTLQETTDFFERRDMGIYSRFSRRSKTSRQLTTGLNQMR